MGGSDTFEREIGLADTKWVSIIISFISPGHPQIEAIPIDFAGKMR